MIYNAITDRRTLLKGLLTSAGAATAGAALTACGSGSGTAGTSTDPVPFGSQWSDPVPRKAYAEVVAAYTKKSGVEVKVNTMDHETFPKQLNSYLQGRPDDVFTWCAGYRSQFFAERGLLTPIDDVWSTIGANYSDALKQQSRGLDGKQYFVPFYYYPWALFYRKSVFEQHGYQIPTKLDELTALCTQMRKDGLVPIAFADKDGWPAMGTFDILNLRVNGYQFHNALMKGEKSWTDPAVAKVFDTWRGLLPHHQENALGRTWQEAAQAVASKKAGMYMIGMFVGQQFNPADQADLDFFAFPEIDPAIGMDALDAPIDGFLLSRNPKNEKGSKKFLEYLASAEAQTIYLKNDPSNIATALNADVSGYSPLQKKAVELISSAKSISQFMDRDTRPDFASTVMVPSIQEFLKNPTDVGSLLLEIEKQKKTIFTS
jgi:multiple sugar transport system substrate-binding protein